MKYINLDAAVTERRLKEGKPIYYDREELQSRIKSAYEDYIKPDPKDNKRIKVPTEEGMNKISSSDNPKIQSEEIETEVSVRYPGKLQEEMHQEQEKKDLRRTSQANQGTTTEET